MSRLIETIKLDDGKFYNLAYHEARMNTALSGLFEVNKPANLSGLLAHTMYPKEGLYKCRVLYDAVDREIKFEPYTVRQVARIKAVADDHISYDFKFEDRSELNRLFALRGDCDDILVIKNGKVTDCSYANIIFRKNGTWFTPDTPLLCGTMRQKLLEENKIYSTEIWQGDIRSYEAFRLINAMLEFHSPEIEVSNIVF